MALGGGTVEIVGGSGMLGRTIALALLGSGVVAARNLWISNRSGRLAGFEAYPGLTVTRINQALAEACDVIVLSVPPDRVADPDIDAGDTLVVSVMAGVSLDALRTATGAERVVRAMCSPAAEQRLSWRE